MAVRLVTYDLNNEVVRPNITKKIKDTWKSCVKLSESCYAIETSMTVEQVYNVLAPLLHDDDAIFIFNLESPYTGYGDDDVVDWLENAID